MQKLSLSSALVLGLLTAIGPICTDLYLPALPDMTQQMSTTTSLTQLSLTASLIGLGLGQLFFGQARAQAVRCCHAQLPETNTQAPSSPAFLPC